MEMIRQFPYSATKDNSLIFTQICMFPVHLVEKACSKLADLKTIKKINFSRKLTQNSFQPSEKVLAAKEKYEEALANFSSLPNILSKKSSIPDLVLEDLLILAGDKSIELRKFGSNFLISRQSSDLKNFSIFSPSNSLTNSWISLIHEGRSWHFPDGSLNETFFCTCKWNFLNILSCIPGCKLEFLFSQLSFLISWNDFCILTSALISMNLILKREEGFLFLNLNLDKIDAT
jgi:hypothetical protein